MNWCGYITHIAYLVLFSKHPAVWESYSSKFSPTFSPNSIFPLNLFTHNIIIPLFMQVPFTNAEQEYAVLTSTMYRYLHVSSTSIERQIYVYLFYVHNRLVEHWNHMKKKKKNFWLAEILMNRLPVLVPRTIHLVSQQAAFSKRKNRQIAIISFIHHTTVNKQR